MKRYLWLVVAVVVAGAAAWYFTRGTGDNVAIDLLKEFPNAVERRPNPDLFTTAEVKIQGVAKMAIVPNQQTQNRIKWHITVPNDAFVKVDLGLEESSWTMKGDGVKFAIGVSEGANFEELVSLVIDPFNNPDHRRWHAVAADLSPYAGQTVDLIFNTYSSPAPQPGQAPKDDRNGDKPVWGAPRITVR